MKKLKKLFNLLPAFALAVISGLGVVLDLDQTAKPVGAYYQTYDTAIGNYTYNDVATYEYDPLNEYERVVNTFTTINFDTQCRLMNNISNGIIINRQYQFVVSVHMVNNIYGVFDFEVSNTRTIGIGAEDVNVKLYAQRFQFSNINGSGRIQASVYFRWLINDTTWSVINDLYGVAQFNIDLVTNYNEMCANTNVSFSQSEALVNELDYSYDDTQGAYDSGFADGYDTGYSNGSQDGYDSGFNTGYDNGYDSGYNEAYETQQENVSKAYDTGYSDGYNDGFSVDSTTATIFSGILQVGLLPVNVLLAIFNFEILGINLSAFISAILTVCLTVIVIRTVTGGKNTE